MRHCWNAPPACRCVPRNGCAPQRWRAPCPPPPVAAINREHYVELARLASNLNQLTHLANEGGRVAVADGLLQRLIAETRRLRLALLGVKEQDDDR